MRAEIISVGTELLLGDIVNTNAQFIAQQLASLGYSVYYQTVVGDNAKRLRHLVLEAKSRSDILIFTGGLGPTDDDLTKQTVAEAFDDRLTLDAEELVHLERFFANRGWVMTENNKKQAMVPVRGKKLPNHNGTAPGAFFRSGSKYAILLPGPPREMKPMFLEYAMPILETMQDSAIRSLTLRTFGIGESSLEEKVFTLLSNPNPTAALYAKTGEVHIRITAKASTAEQADVMCDEYAALFYTALGDKIYSSNNANLETTAVHNLLQTEQTVATAESCTGGLLGERITSVPGASGVYGFGAITYANDVKRQLLGVKNSTLRKHGAVSSQVAAEMAFGALHQADTDFGIGITGIAGPGGGTPEKPVGLVYVALATSQEVYIKKLDLGGRDREYVRALATNHALDMLRRITENRPIPDAKIFAKHHEADYDRESAPKKKNSGITRLLIALLATLLFLALLITGLNQAGRKPAESQPENASSLSSQGLVYGTSEYTSAAMSLVQSERSINPAIAGFIAFPGGVVETFCAQSSNGKQAELAKAQSEAGLEGLPILAADAIQNVPGSNVLILGQQAFSPLLDFGNSYESRNFSTFTYFTQAEERVYQIYSVYLVDDHEHMADGFDPALRQITGYTNYLSFLLGLRARSLYDLEVDANEQDSFMTLAVEDPNTLGRKVYISGRRLRLDEKPRTIPAAVAGQPLMPKLWYAQKEIQPPNTAEIYSWWLRWYLTRHASNPALQVAAGMPAQDVAPTIPPPRVSAPAPQEAKEETPSSTEKAENLSFKYYNETLISSISELVPLVPSASSEESSSSSAVSSSSTSNSSSSSSASSQAPAPAAATSSSAASSSSASSSAITSSSSGKSSSSSSLPQEDSSVSTGPTLKPLPQPLPTKPDPAYLTVTMNGQIVTDTTVNILAQICQSEAGTMDPAAVKAVAIAAHSWILNQQGAGDRAPAVVGRPPSAAVLNAVREVEQVILTGDGENPAFTPWFSMAAQGTNTSQDVWGTERPYLIGVESPYEQGNEQWRTIVQISQEDFSNAVLERLGIDLVAISKPDKWIGEIQKNNGGYVQTIQIGGTEVSGVSLWTRVLLQDGMPILPSFAFEVEYDGEGFTFICYGAGHGCGLSLQGAAQYAQQGWTYQSILEHYFPGSKLATW